MPVLRIHEVVDECDGPTEVELDHTPVVDDGAEPVPVSPHDEELERVTRLDEW